MIVGSDFDGVIADDTAARIEYTWEKHKVVLLPDEVHGSKLEKRVGKKIKQELDDCVNCSNLSLNFSPSPNVKEVFTQLIENGDKVIIITGRSEKGANLAKKFMKKHKIPFTKVLSAREVGKEKLIRKEKVKVYVEDSDNFLKKLIHLKSTSLFVFDRPPNRHFSSKKVERVHTWNELYEKIQSLKTRK